MPRPLVAVARVIRLRDDPRAAEVAMTVTDALQGRGLGSKLLELLVVEAKEHGIERLVAHVVDGNTPIKRLLQKSGPLESTRGAAYRSPSPDPNASAVWPASSPGSAAIRARPERGIRRTLRRTS